MVWLWFIIAMFLFAVSVYLIGRYVDDSGEAYNVLGATLVGSLLWPLVLIAILIFGPFFGLYYLGIMRAEKAKEMSGKNKSTK